ncbi:c-type cytochrome [Alcaligenes phenolicus]|uniref:c-type cytochrome n=1 Tax=Alcaligenes phenolicus TaxID=232846 RepID=UPI002BD6BAAA|nr:c-type cytochrome [Alcaligenes phenolicus]HRO19642.1 c-type cytochrome [Alcaligenes phenolicus]HRP14482.1 c-type cytochrome [Alcaligenes phenolicus]
MSNTEQKPEEHNEGHSAMIKTPKQLLVTVALAFLVPIAIIVMLVSLVTSTMGAGAGSAALSPEAIAARIQPVAGFKLVDANAVKELKTGQQVYETTCTACHGAGVAGAPKFGDKGAWGELIKLGQDELVKNAIHGIRAMPAKGGNPSLDDIEVARAVAYMANAAGADFKEPDAPAPEGEEADAKPEATAAADTKPAEAAEAPKATETAAAAADDSKVDPAGIKLYDTICFACHAAGVAGAPKFGDQAAWKPYIESGMDTMVQKAIHGVGAMPPRGGSQASDDEIRAAIQHMVNAAK